MNTASNDGGGGDTPTLSDLIACAKRELAMRQRVYPKWVAAGRMTQAKADWEISCMEAILEILHERKRRGG